MENRVNNLIEAAKRFVRINQRVDRGNMYISRAGADEHNAALVALLDALDDAVEQREPKGDR